MTTWLEPSSTVQSVWMGAERDLESRGQIDLFLANDPAQRHADSSPTEPESGAGPKALSEALMTP